MPTRMTVNNSEKTARKAPSRMATWRNHTISSPTAAKPERATATPVKGTSTRPAAPSGLAVGCHARRWPGGCRIHPSPPRHGERAEADQGVHRHREQLRAMEAGRGNEPEVGEEAPDRRAGGVHRVERRNRPALRLGTGAHEVTDEQRERAPHQEGDGQQQHNRDQGHGPPRRRGEHPPAGRRIARVGRQPGRDVTQLRQGQGDGQTQARNHQLGDAVGAQERAWARRVAPVGPAADEVAPHAEPEHEDGDDEGGGLNGVAEDVAECPHPDDLIDQPAQARTQEEQMNQARHVPVDPSVPTA